MVFFIKQSRVSPLPLAAHFSYLFTYFIALNFSIANLNFKCFQLPAMIE